MPSYEEAYKRARANAEQELRYEAMARFGAENVVEYVPIPGLSSNYIYDWSKKFEIIYTVERSKTVQTGSNDHIGVYSDGSTVLLDSKPVYGTANWIETRKDVKTAYYKFVVLKNPSLASEYRRLANDMNREVAYYDFKGNEDEGVVKAKQYVRKRMIHEGFIMLVVSLFLFVITIVGYTADSASFEVYKNILLYGDLGTLAYLFLYQFIRKRNEEEFATVAQEKNVRSSQPTYTFADMGIIAFCLFNLWIFGNDDMRVWWVFVSIAAFVMLILSIKGTKYISKGNRRIANGREYNSRMIQRRNSAEYRNYYNKCVNFCKTSFR